MNKNGANALWKGTLKKGNGKVRLDSTNYETEYTYSSRFGDGKGTNPEELIAAAEAACFSMALSDELSKKGYEPLEIKTTAQVTLSTEEKSSSITEIDLSTSANVKGIEINTFLEIAEEVKQNCPVSQALSSVNINMQAKLINTG